MAAAVGPLARDVLRLPVPGKEVFDSIQGLYEQLEDMRTLLLDPKHSSVRLVLNPEKMVTKETQRIFTYLNLYGYHTDLLVCNRILPETVGDDFFSHWREAHSRYLQLIKESFEPLPIRRAPLLDHEVVGVEDLKNLRDLVFGELDPTQMFYAERVEEVLKVDGGYQLRVKLPFAHGQDLSITEAGNEVVVHIGTVATLCCPNCWRPCS